MLAGISADYYVRLEQGRERHPSAEVMDGLARVFQLDERGVQHLRALAAAPLEGRTARKAFRLPPGLLGLLEVWTDQAVLVQTNFRDVVACTPLAAAMHPGLARDHNMLRLLFLDAEERSMYRDWETAALDAVAWLHAAAGADTDDSRLTALVGELSVQSPDFARMWARHDVRVKSGGFRRLDHPTIGRVTVHFNTFTVNQDSNLSMTVYHAEPGTADSQALGLLAQTVAPAADAPVATPSAQTVGN